MDVCEFKVNCHPLQLSGQLNLHSETLPQIFFSCHIYLRSLENNCIRQIHFWLLNCKEMSDYFQQFILHSWGPEGFPHHKVHWKLCYFSRQGLTQCKSASKSLCSSRRILSFWSFWLYWLGARIAVIYLFLCGAGDETLDLAHGR